jgi:hypothetical protein
MESLFDSVTVRVSAGFLTALILVFIYFSFDILQFFTGRDFGNANVYLVNFTRHNRDSKDDQVLFELLDYKIPLREIYRNRFTFWIVMYHAFHANLSSPVLNFGSRGKRILAPVRGRVARIWSGMVLKRVGGLVSTEFPACLCLAYSQPGGSGNRVIRILIIPKRDIRSFDEYKKNPPRNTNNFAEVEKLVKAYRKGKDASFIDVRVTVA